MDAPTTPDGELVWHVLNTCRNQLRTIGTGRPIALDHGAVMTVGSALGADVELLADVLPAAEAAIISGLNDDEEGE